jgi:hypothetical protein
MSRPEGESDGGGFLGRWAKRKQEARQEGLKPAPVPDAVAIPAVSETAPAEAEKDLLLPSLDSIVPGADVSAFFHRHVPEALRTAALRKLWVTDPQIKNFIEMADYQWDFNNPDAIPGWSSSVGDFDVKGLLDKIMGETKVEAPAVSAPNTLPEQAPVVPEIKVEPKGSGDDEQAPQAISENTDSTDKSVLSVERTEHAAADLIQNGAPQKSSDESSVYEPVRKRHGGALPT